VLGTQQQFYFHHLEGGAAAVEVGQQALLDSRVLPQHLLNRPGGVVLPVSMFPIADDCCTQSREVGEAPQERLLVI
jgi:hypothetical protein